ncbi:MAG: zinc ribbon domain-containing protein [Gaiellaceae bacterium]
MKTCPNCGQSTRDDDRFCPSCGQPTDPRRQSSLVTEERSPRRQAAVSAASNVAGYAAALKRFWWVLVIGLLFAMFAALSARFTVSFFPPSLDEKEEISYTAEARLLVNSASNPHFRSQETTLQPIGPVADDTDPTSEEGDNEPTLVPYTQPPDLNTIIRNANTYPFLIESDGVADFRRQRFGELPGAVSAIGATSVVTANRVELSEIPVIRLVATAGSPEDAIGLADKTGKAFIGWLQQEQIDDNIRKEDRMVVEQLTIPKGAIASAGPSTTLPILVFVVVFAAFCVLAILLDRLVPARPKPARSDVEPLEQPVKVKKTA